MPELILLKTDMAHNPLDPRDPPVSVRVDPDVDPWLTLTRAPLNGATAASIHLAKVAQQRERHLALENDEPYAAEDLRLTQLMDSAQAAAIVAVMTPDRPLADRRQAAAVAVRLHDPHFQTVSRYRAANAALRVLRNLLSAHGVDGTIADSDLRKAADQIAGVTQVARMRTWDGSDAVCLREWSGSRLGLLNITEDR